MVVDARSSERLSQGIVVDETLAERPSIMMDNHRSGRLQQSSYLKNDEQELHVSEIIHLFDILLFVLGAVHLLVSQPASVVQLSSMFSHTLFQGTLVTNY